MPLALADSSFSYYSKEIRLQLFGTNQERAIAEIEGRAGSYKIDETLTGKPIVKVDLSFSEIDADCIRVVGNLPHLRYLSLLETSVTDDDIVPLGDLTELRVAEPDVHSHPSAGLLQLKGMVLLQSLNLQCTQLGDEGLACITSMSSLRELDLGFTGITDQALAFFRVTDSQDDLAGPHGLMKLGVLNLKETRIDGPGLANLANLADLANLKTIYLDSSQVSDDGLAGLEKLTALRALNLANTQISDKGLGSPRATEAAPLKALNVGRTKISRAGIERLRKALPKVRVGN